MNSVKFKIHDLAYHRNGVHGNGFAVVLFSDNTRGPAIASKKFMAVLFEEPGNAAILNCAKLSRSNIAFGENSWRSEDFEKA